MRAHSRNARVRPSPVPTADQELRRELRQRHAFEALSRMRTRGETLAQAAREVGESPATIVRRVGPALRKDRHGRWAARPTDRLIRSLEILTPHGKVAIRVRGSRLASVIAGHHNAVKDYLEGRPSALRQFRGITIRAGRRAYPLLTDPRRVREFADAGELSFETIYSTTG